ncbi:MAG: metalloregulator ArsR/SmtB family transcription factor [Phycisphaerae bacterium]
MEHNPHDVFQALAEPTRRAILDLLTGRRMPAGQIARHFPLSRPAVSKHLTILKMAGLLQEDRLAQQRLYSIQTHNLETLLEWLSSLQAPTGVEHVVNLPKSMPITTLRPPRVAVSRPAFELEFD